MMGMSRSLGGRSEVGLTSIEIPEGVTSIGKAVFKECNSLRSIEANDITMLPNDMKRLAAIGYAKNQDADETPRKKAHLKYLKANAAKLINEATDYPELLRLILENKLLKAENVEDFMKAAAEKNNTEATAMLLDYQANKLTAKEKEAFVQKAEEREEKVTDFIFSVEAPEKLKGKTFVVSGKLKTFASRDEFKACLDALGAVLSETLNRKTAYLITNTPDSGSAKNKKADSLGVKKLTEEEFNAMIGRTAE